MAKAKPAVLTEKTVVVNTTETETIQQPVTEGETIVETETSTDETVVQEQTALEAKEESVEQEQTAEEVQPKPEDQPQPEIEAEVKVESQPTPNPVVDPKPIEKEVEAGGPRPRTRGTRLIKTEITPPITTLSDLTIDIVVKRKHGFDLADASEPLKEILEFLNRYETTMQQGEGIQPLIAESLQKQLFKNYLKIFTLGNLERSVAMECLLWKFFRNETRVWRVSTLSRYTRNGKWNIGELQMFLQLNNIFNLIKDPSDRIARIRSIRLGATVKDFPGEKIQYTDALLSWSSSLK